MPLAAFPDDDPLPDDPIPDGDLGDLDFDLPADFFIPDDLSELDDAPPPIHEDKAGNIYEDGAALAGSGAPTAPGGVGATGVDVHQPTSSLPVNFGDGPGGQGGSSSNTVAGLEGGLGAQVDAGFAEHIDAELAAITGESRELALLLTPVIDARPLAAVLALVGVAADCIPTPSGAVVVLRDKDGNQPDQAAKVLSQALAQTSVLLVTKATGQLSAERYVAGASQGEVPAGLIVAGASGVVEDLLVGAMTPAEVPGLVSSVGLSRAKAMMWLGGAAGNARRRSAPPSGRTWRGKGSNIRGNQEPDQK